MEENLGRFEAALGEAMTQLYEGEQRLHQACRYALAGKGKRIRPLLTLAAARACGLGDPSGSLPAAVAVEMIHTYSLVHDDLPCMDNDDLRRGRATTHKAFDEGTALLVGDALLTDAFSLIADAPGWAPPEKAAMISILARAAGGRGMVYGQALDIAFTGQGTYTAADLDAIHSHKTGNLIEAACILGGLSASASAQQLSQLRIFGAAVGLAFQIIDDLIDEGPLTGKTPGKDKALGKLTYLSVMGASRARERALELTQRAHQALESFGEAGADLRALAAQLLHREY